MNEDRFVGEVVLAEVRMYGDYECLYCKKPLDGQCVAVAKEDDEEGFQWRVFHEECLGEVYTTPEEVYSNYLPNSIYEGETL